MQLTFEQRVEIKADLKIRLPLCHIAKQIGVHKATISWEMQRHTDFKGYRPHQAQQKTAARRFQGTKHVRFTSMDKERKRKNNRIDARKLARSLKNGDLEPIYVPDRVALEDRSLIRARRNAIKDQTRYKNRIKALTRFYGIQLPAQFDKRNWSGAFIHWLEHVAFVRPSGKQSFQFYIDQLKRLRRQVAELNRQIRKLAQQDRYRERVNRLKTIPGVGTITAMILLTELVEIARFKTADQLASYIGLIPDERSSGNDEDENFTDLTPRSHPYLRSILVECAWGAVRKDPALALCYTSYFNETNCITKNLKI